MPRTPHQPGECRHDLGEVSWWDFALGFGWAAFIAAMLFTTVVT